MFESLLRHSRLLIGEGHIRRNLLRGTARGANVELHVSYQGSDQTLPFIIKQLFDSERKTTTQALPESPVVDLRIEERSPLAGLLHPPEHHLRMPAWISQQIELRANNGFDFSRHVRREAERHIRRSDYRLDFSPEPPALSEFYRDMYLPYVRSRFEDQAIVVDESTFMRRAAGQILARLHAGSTWTAGMLLSREAQTLRFGWYGVRATPPPPGASEVLDVLLIRWARQQGLRQVVLGHSRPCLRDGVLRYKRRLGAQIHATRFPQPQIFLHLERPSEWLARCLNEAGFLRMRGGSPRAYRIDLRSGETRTVLEPVQHERH